MGKSSPPAAPNYAAAAEKTAQGNQNAALAAQLGNMVNQSTPYGNVTYTPNLTGADLAYFQSTGKLPTDKKGNLAPVQWSQTVTMTPEMQAMFNQNMGINQSLLNTATTLGGQAEQAALNPLTAQEFTSTAGDPEALNQAMTNAMYRQQSQYLDPQFQQAQSNLENKLANQGITQGSEAYDRAMLNFNNQKQQAYESARNAAISQGMNAAQGMFGMNLQNANLANQAAQSNLAQQQTLQQNPINMLNAIRSGAQTQVAQMPQVGVSQPGNLSNWSGPDYLSAANQQYNTNLNNWNYNQAQNQQTMQGILKGAGMLAML